MTVLEVLPFCVNGANDGTFLVLTLCWCEFTKVSGWRRRT